MVRGLVYQVTATETGMFLRNGIATSSALSICTGPGIMPQNMPIPTAPGTERRLRCHRFGWPSHGRNGAHHGWARIASGSEEHTSELQSHSFISYAVFCLKN